MFIVFRWEGTISVRTAGSEEPVISRSDDR